jgi:ribonuclease III
MDSSQGSPIEESPHDLARRISLKFVNIELLTRALTHRSYINEHKEAIGDNERLEFLGDAVLDFLVGAWLYNHYPEMAEGQLTRMRAALVGNQQLADFAREIDLGSAMRLGRGEAENGGRDRQALLGATFEAVIGALYLDQGTQPVRKFVEPMLASAAEDIIDVRGDQDAKSQLQEWSQSQGYGPPTYQTISDSGPDHDKCFELEVIINGQIYGRGQGHSKQEAAKAAAKATLELLGLG